MYGSQSRGRAAVAARLQPEGAQLDLRLPRASFAPKRRNNMTDPHLNDQARADDPEVPDIPVPPGPEPREPDENKAFTSPINEL